MKDKLLTRCREFKHNHPYAAGIVVGGTVAIATTHLTIYALNMQIINKDWVHIPDGLVDSVLENGLPVLLTRRADGAQLSLGPS